MAILLELKARESANNSDSMRVVSPGVTFCRTESTLSKNVFVRSLPQDREFGDLFEADQYTIP